MRLQSLLTMLLVPVVGACTHGVRPNAVPFSTTAGGANVTYWVKGDPAKRYGELFAVNDSAVYVRTERLSRIPWARLNGLDVDRLGSRFDVYSGRLPDAEKRKRLALVSRFPQGLSGLLLAQVLTALKQDAVEDVP